MRLSPNWKRGNAAPRRPLTTLAEFARKHGVTHGQLVSIMGPLHGPAPARPREHDGQLNYYDPIALERWFKEVRHALALPLHHRTPPAARPGAG